MFEEKSVCRIRADGMNIVIMSFAYHVLSPSSRNSYISYSPVSSPIDIVFMSILRERDTDLCAARNTYTMLSFIMDHRQARSTTKSVMSITFHDNYRYNYAILTMQ